MKFDVPARLQRELRLTRVLAALVVAGCAAGTPVAVVPHPDGSSNAPDAADACVPLASVASECPATWADVPADKAAFCADPRHGLFDAFVSAPALSPYASMVQAMSRLALKAEQSAISADRCAKVIDRCLTARRPPVRVLVGMDAKLGALLKSTLPARTMDWLLAKAFGTR